MKEKDSLNPNNADDFEIEGKNKYYDFFDYAPVALYIEDFSKLKNFVTEKAKECNLDLKSYLEKYPDYIKSLHRLVIIKEVNNTAVKLFKATSKRQLLENLEKVFTPDSANGFYKLVVDIFTGKKESVVETVNKTLDGDIINILIKFNVETGSEETLENVIVSIENITKRVATNNALDISKKNYKEAQEIAKLSSWYYDFETNKTFWSDELYKLIGLSSSDSSLNLDLFFSYVHEDDYDKMNDFSISNLIENPNQELNYRIKTIDGEIKHLYEKRSSIIKNGKIEKVISICQDVTDRIVSGQSLSMTKQLLSNTLSSIQDGFVILDENSNYLYVNEMAATLLGKNIDDLMGKNIWDEFPEREGDLFYDNYQIAYKTRRSLSFENYFAPWKRWFKNRIIPSNDTILIFFHETTEKKESENKIKEAYNIINKSSSVAILCENKWNFPVVFASENADKLFGYSAEELLLGKIKTYELVHPDDLIEVRPRFLKKIKSDKEIESEPEIFRIITKSGEIKWLETSFDIIKNSKNEITHIQGVVQDITQRKITEDLFFKSNQRLQDQFNNTPLASIIWDLDFKVLEWNNSAQRIFGYSLEEAKGNHAKELIVLPSTIEKIDKIWKNLLLQKAGFRSKNKNTTKSGKVIICDWYNVALKDVNGNVIGVASLIDDITERTESKQLLENSEKKYRDIFEKSIDAVLILKDGLIIDCNVSTLKMFDYSSKESLLKVHPSAISPEIQPDGFDSFEKAKGMIQIALEEGSNRFRWYHKQKNGHVFPAEVTLTKIDEDHKATIHAVVKDITERVKKEEIENILYNISKAAISIDDFQEFGNVIKDELNKIIDTSNFFIALYNEEKDAFHTPIMVDEYDDIKDFPAEGTLTEFVVKTKKSLMFTDETTKNLIEKGRLKLIGSDSKVWLGVPLKTQEKAFGAIVVQSYTNENAYNKNDVQLLEFVADQISSAIQRKNTDNELKLALRKARESDRLKSAFLANMSHEIRTPMNGIIGFSELFLDKELSYSERKDYAKIVINSSKQLLSIVNDILDISKIEAGVIQLNNERVIVNELLNEIMVFYLPIAKEKNIELTCVKGLKNFDCIIKIDRTKLHQVLTNLLSNAFKFTDYGSVEFGYELVEDKLKFHVKDTGTGIPENLHEKIFDRFIQADSDYEKQSKGTGLGLAISKKFVEMFGGEIWLEPQNIGTTICFTIPYIKLKAKPLNSVIGIKPKIKEDICTSILVAEDEVYNLMYINELFSKSNYKIIEASNGLEAVEIAKSNPEISLVLMDIKMPVMNGKDAMNEIKKIKPDLPVIALSAFAMESDKEIALENGFDSYLSKPIDRKLLFALIEQYTT